MMISCHALPDVMPYPIDSMIEVDARTSFLGRQGLKDEEAGCEKKASENAC